MTLNTRWEQALCHHQDVLGVTSGPRGLRAGSICSGHGHCSNVFRTKGPHDTTPEPSAALGDHSPICGGSSTAGVNPKTKLENQASRVQTPAQAHLKLSLTRA